MKRVEQCRGFRLWRSKARRIELWFCWTGVRAHKHPGQRVEVLPLYGWATFFRVNDQGEGQSVEVHPASWLNWFTIPAGWLHWFELRRGPLIFLNKTFDGQSAADNFV